MKTIQRILAAFAAFLTLLFPPSPPRVPIYKVVPRPGTGTLKLRRAGECFANEAAAAEDFLLFANQLAADDKGWVQLAPFGDFANVDKAGKPVIQRFQRADAEAIVNEFNGLLNLPQRLLGLPWYIGHPDHPRFKGQPGHTNTAAVGRIKGLEAREDGLYANVKFNSAGRQLVEDEAFHGHSVNWLAAPAGSEGGKAIFRPHGLKSVGFTNQPQIPVKPATLANEETTAIEIVLGTDKFSVFLANDESAALPERVAKLATDLANEQSARAAEGQKVTAAEAKLQAAEQALANERRERATLIVAPLVKAGRILTADKEAKITELANAGDQFDAVATAFANATPAVKTTAKTGDLGRQNVELQDDVRARQDRFEALMAKREQEFANEDYDVRFAAVAASPEGAQLFALMKRAGAAD